MPGIGIGFSRFGLLVVVLQLLPNILWALWPPAPNRLAGNMLSIPFLELGEHVLRVALVIMLVFLVPGSRTSVPAPPRLSVSPLAGVLLAGRWMLASLVAIGLYWFFWALYFTGVQSNAVVYSMVILPPVAFFSAGAGQRLWPICVVSVLFLLVHMRVALEQFPLGVG